jgi:SET domain-containing protein
MINIEEKDLRFYISESTQPNAGRGLFAAQSIRKGDHLEVIGVMVDRESVSDICTSYANAFKFAADYSDSYKKHLIPMGYGGIVNHANNKKDQNVEIRYIKKGSENICVYYFLRDVKKDEEILGNYGEGWNALDKWVKEANSDQSDDEHSEWISFLELNLYNLGKLKR